MEFFLATPWTHSRSLSMSHSLCTSSYMNIYPPKLPIFVAILVFLFLMVNIIQCQVRQQALNTTSVTGTVREAIKFVVHAFTKFHCWSFQMSQISNYNIRQTTATNLNRCLLKTFMDAEWLGWVREAIPYHFSCFFIKLRCEFFSDFFSDFSPLNMIP